MPNDIRHNAIGVFFALPTWHTSRKMLADQAETKVLA